MHNVILPQVTGLTLNETLRLLGYQIKQSGDPNKRFLLRDGKMHGPFDSDEATEFIKSPGEYVEEISDSPV